MELVVPWVRERRYVGMAATVKELEKRLAQLEHEVARLRELVEPPVDETPAQRGARLLRQAKASQPAISAAIAKAFEEMGITGEPIGAEKVQEMMLAEGIRPEDNEFSRGIIEMREE
jgi:anti-sigma factor RsiW